MILDKNFKFLLCLYWGKIVLEIAFGDVLDRTQAFLRYKNVDFWELPSRTFPKGLVHDSGQKF